jgi:hypothetical protein
MNRLTTNGISKITGILDLDSADMMYREAEYRE